MERVKAQEWSRAGGLRGWGWIRGGRVRGDAFSSAVPEGVSSASRVRRQTEQDRARLRG